MKTNQKLQNFTNILSQIFLVCLGLLAFQSIFGQAIFGFEMANYSLGNFILSFIEKAQYGIVILAIASGTLVFYVNREEVESVQKKIDNKKIEKKWKSKYNILLIILILFWFIVKIFLITKIQNPYHDEGFHILQLFSLEKGNIIPIFESGRIELRGLLFNYISFFNYKIFDFTELFSIRLTSVIFSSLSLIVLYLIISNIFNKKIGIIVTTIFSFNSFFIGYSILGRFYIEAFFWFLIFIYLFFILGKKNIFIKGMIGLLSFMSFFYNIVLLGVLFIKEMYEKRYKDGIKTIIIIILIILFWHFVINGLANIDGIIKSKDSSLNISFDVTYGQSNFYTNHFKTYGLILFIFLGLTGYGLFKRKINLSKKIYLLLIIIGIIGLALFTTNWYNLRYLLNGYFLFIILIISFSLYYIQIFSKIYNNNFIIILFILFSIFYLNINSSFNGKDLFHKNGYFLYNYVNGNIESNQSILLTTSAINNKKLIKKIKNECNNKECILFTSDIYNTHVMFKNYKNIKTYLINNFLLNKGGYTYNKEGKTIGLYSNLEYIEYIDKIIDIEKRNINKEIYFITRESRLYDQNKGEISNYFTEEYEIIDKTKDIYKGNYGKVSYDKYILFKHKK